MVGLITVLKRDEKKEVIKFQLVCYFYLFNKK